MPDTKECFIIMPLTTPELMVKEYRDGKEHFRHVLDCLFVPAVKKAGYVPKPPKAEGSDLIHGEIIKNLDSADIILCDMSCLNANVFFEFGIRTALNKPVCVVKDEKTENVPFDTGIINYQDYDSSVEPWRLESEIEKLTDHIKKSVERSKGENKLWKYFGIKSEAVPYVLENTSEAKLDYIRMQLESLNEKLTTIAAERETVSSTCSPKFMAVDNVQRIFNYIDRKSPAGVRIRDIRTIGDTLLVLYEGQWDRKHRDLVEASSGAQFGYKVNIVPSSEFYKGHEFQVEK